jgi:hypothetical protein
MAMHAGHRIGTKLGHDDRPPPLLPRPIKLLLKAGPRLRQLATQHVPAPVAVHANDIALLHPRGRAARKGHDGDQARGVEVSGALEQRFEKGLTERY